MMAITTVVVVVVVVIIINKKHRVVMNNNNNNGEGGEENYHHHALSSELRKTSVVINVWATIVSILSVSCIILLVIVICVSENLGESRKHILVGSLVGVFTVASQVALFVVRRASDVPTLISLTCITFLLTGACFMAVIFLF